MKIRDVQRTTKRVISLLMAILLMFSVNVTARPRRVERPLPLPLDETLEYVIDEYATDDMMFDAVFNNVIITPESENLVSVSPPVVNNDIMIAESYDVLVSVSPERIELFSSDYEIVVSEKIPYYASTPLDVFLQYHGYTLCRYEYYYLRAILLQQQGGEEISALNQFIPASTTLTISPMTAWLSIPAAGGAQWTVVVSSNTSWNVSRPSWLNMQLVSGGFRLT